MKLFETRVIANELMKKHIDESGWTFQFDNAKRRFGYCSLDKRVISISAPLTQLNDEPTLRNIILHEIAHAVAGSGHGHDRHWKTIAQMIGCDGNRTYSPVVVAQPKKTWRATCPTCKHSYDRLRRTNVSCGRCDNVYNPKHLIEWNRI